jgi:hypothetical protein
LVAAAFIAALIAFRSGKSDRLSVIEDDSTPVVRAGAPSSAAVPALARASGGIV